MDDRTLKAAPGSRAKESLSKALLVTSEFDQAVGLLENVSKRQHWEGEEKVEHLGLRLQGHFAKAPVMKKLALPRAGWDGIEETIKRLAMVPGGQGTRTKVAQCFWHQSGCGQRRC